jgi:hypothetical protein
MLTPKERVLPENWYLFGENKYAMYLSNVHSRNFNYLADHWREFAALNGKETVENKMRHMYQQITEYCLRGWYFKDSRKNIHPYDKKEFDHYRKQIQRTEMTDKDQLLVLIDIANAAGKKDTGTITTLMVKNISRFSAENQKTAFTYLGMFPSSTIRKNPDIQQFIEAIITSNKNENLVRFAKSMQ